MTDQKSSGQNDLREIADVLETDSHYSGSDESKRRARYAATLREHAAAMDATRPVALSDFQDGAVDERIEWMYWKFDAARKGDGEYRGRPQSERDAFKAVARDMLVAIQLANNAMLKIVRLDERQKAAPPASKVQDAGDWHQYAKDGESAQDVIERERKDSAAFVQLYLSDERNRRNDKLLYGFMLDCNAIGLKGAAENLHRGIKEHLANLTGAANGSGEQGGGNG